MSSVFVDIVRALANISASCTKCRKAIAEAGGVDVLLDLVRQSHIESYQCAAEAAETALVNITALWVTRPKSRKVANAGGRTEY